MDFDLPALERPGLVEHHEFLVRPDIEDGESSCSSHEVVVRDAYPTARVGYVIVESVVRVGRTDIRGARAKTR